MTPATEGRCLCGGVRYAVDGPFLYSGYCHCARCRQVSGSAFSAFAAVEKKKLRVTDGECLVGTFERNPDNIVSRCRTCGSPLFALVGNGGLFHVTMGTLADDPGIRPACHIFVGSKAPWYEIADTLPQYDGLPPEDT